MKEGFWINYQTDEAFEIEDHECWIRDPANAWKIGVNPEVFATFADYQPRKDRKTFLPHVMANASLIRFRGHGVRHTFEFADKYPNKPLNAILRFRQKTAGPFTTLKIANFANQKILLITYRDFAEKMKKLNPESLFSTATTFQTTTTKES